MGAIIRVRDEQGRVTDIPAIRGPHYTPSVDDSGNLSWTNNAGLPNPETKNVRGPLGPSGVYVGEDEPEDANVLIWLNQNGVPVQYATEAYVGAAVGAEEDARVAADGALQEQIDAITSQSDVVDVVGTYEELNAYDKPIYAYDIVKVLSDSTHGDAIAYYRALADSPTYNWSYLGSQGPFYTKSETDTKIAAAIGNAIGGAY